MRAARTTNVSTPSFIPKKRCAIYTRKSTEEGLDQEYNSLEAQRDAGLSFVSSQRHEGWLALDDTYDDGGFSGGNIDRPGLKRLMADIEARKIDVVVVYKIDRLSRSLADFAKMVEIFDQHKVSFSSVTQQINSATSMGRLMLNVLLSFAQFEREVIGERIRDKFAASRKRGMWMGGSVPFGYDVRDRKLVVNADEAATVVRALLETEAAGAEFVHQLEDAAAADDQITRPDDRRFVFDFFAGDFVRGQDRDDLLDFFVCWFCPAQTLARCSCFLKFLLTILLTTNSSRYCTWIFGNNGLVALRIITIRLVLNIGW